MGASLISISGTAILAIVVAGPPLDLAVAKPAPSAAQVEQRVITLRGCLRSWDGTPDGIGRSGAAEGRPMQFVLTDTEVPPVAVLPRPSGSTAGVPHEPATPSAAHETYVVVAANDAVKLDRYLDRQVEVSGTLVVVPPHDATQDAGDDRRPPAAAPAGAAPTGAAAPPSSTAATPKVVQRVTAREVTVIATTCGK